jgi:hypothetical protein
MSNNTKIISILGAGESGTGAAILANKQGWTVFVSDKGKIPEKYQTELIVGDAGFSGISGVRIKQMQLIPAQRDTLLILGEFSLRIKFLYALIGDIRIAEVTLNEGYLQLTKRDSIKNFDSFLVQTEDSLV